MSKLSATAPPIQRNSADLRWWEQKTDAQIAESISATLKVMDRVQAARVSQLLINARLYGNVPITTTAGLAYTAFRQANTATRERLTYCLVQSAIDTAIAKLSRNRPKPYFLTSGGNFKEQRKAKKLNQFVDGMFYEQRAYEKGSLAARDAAVQGDGLIYVHERHGRVVFDRVRVDECWIDEVEGMFGEPRQMHRTTYVDRGVLGASWPGQKDAIAKADPPELRGLNSPSMSDSVLVRESWHLPSGPDAKDGRYVISLEEVVLHKERWLRDHFPFARMPWTPRPFGYWAQGAAEQLSSTQFELNKLLKIIQQAMNKSGAFVIFLENGSKVVKAHLNNEIGSIVNYSGTKPQYETPPICPPELYMQVENLIRRGYEIVGVSQLNATGKKPDGLNSGKALREMDDISTDRFTTIEKQYERFYMDLGKLAIACARELAEEGGNYEVTVPGRQSMRKLDWSAIGLEDDEFVTQCFSVSSFPQEPAARLETVTEYMQAGMIPPDIGQKLLEFPDLAQYESLANAMEERLQDVLDAIADDGEFTPPEPHYNLDRAKELVLQYILRGESQDLEPERLEMLHRWNDALDVMAQMAQDAMAEQAMIAQAAAQPLATPEAPPSSPMLPNAPVPVAA